MSTTNTQPSQTATQKLVSSPNYGKESKWTKLKRKITGKIVRKIEHTPLQFSAYRSYWHYKLSGQPASLTDNNESESFLGQKPNYGAGIGHQLANWNSGLYYAGLFKLRFAHYPFSTAKWEQFLGFGENEISAAEIKTLKKIKLPKFNASDPTEIALIRNIIQSYAGRKVFFQLEMDQGYKNQFDTYRQLSSKFFNARARGQDKLLYPSGSMSIAVHIRRRMAIETLPVWKKRGLDNDYYAKVLSNTLQLLPDNEKISIYLFSQGEKNEFPEFDRFENLHFCLDMNPVDTVLHLINADILISSKSSFSYKPALISRNIKICPETFWHLYPDTPDFILADNDGNFSADKFKSAYGAYKGSNRMHPVVSGDGKSLIENS